MEYTCKRDFLHQSINITMDNTHNSILSSYPCEHMCAMMSKKMSEANKRIKKANNIQNILQGLDISLPDPNYQLTALKTRDRSAHVQKWIFETIKLNVSHFYDSSCPWLDQDKQEEILHPDMWNIIVAGEECNLGFVNFRFDMDEGYDVVYLYEVQVDPEAQRKGIGSLLVRIAESVAKENSITKVVLTSHRNNLSSQRFFREKLGYTDDESSPTTEPVNYDILSKYILQ